MFNSCLETKVKGTARSALLTKKTIQQIYLVHFLLTN